MHQIILTIPLKKQKSLFLLILTQKKTILDSCDKIDKACQTIVEKCADTIIENIEKTLTGHVGGGTDRQCGGWIEASTSK